MGVSVKVFFIFVLTPSFCSVRNLKFTVPKSASGCHPHALPLSLVRSMHEMTSFTLSLTCALCIPPYHSLELEQLYSFASWCSNYFIFFLIRTSNIVIYWVFDNIVIIILKNFLFKNTLKKLIFFDIITSK
jgi:hypothetical protein